jgi:hypothetical protein
MAHRPTYAVRMRAPVVTHGSTTNDDSNTTLALGLGDGALHKLVGLNLSVIERVAGIVGSVVSSGKNVGHQEEELGLDVIGGRQQTSLRLGNANVLRLSTGGGRGTKESASAGAACGVALVAVEAVTWMSVCTL